jgi:class 3 adenylate cyclase
MGEIAAVLVVDMVGSTGMRQSIGEARFGDVKRQLDAFSRRIVANTGGRVVKEQGDGLMAFFPTATGAVAAGVGLLRATSNANRRLAADERFELRVGISAGETSWDEGDLVGMVPVEAARLETAATPGTVYCSDVVRVLTTAGSHRFVPVGELTLKGLRDPVTAWQVAWDASSNSQDLGLPEALDTETRLNFVGRATELELLAAAWEQVRRTSGRVVAIGGEPGVGKTRLCSELARRCLDEGGIVLYGRSDQVVTHPYQPFVEAFTRYVRRTTHLELLPIDVAAELSRLLPELRERVPGIAPPQVADSDTQRYRLFEAMLAWLDLLAEEDPVVMILDDVTWATEPTLDMLSHVTQSLAERRVLCVLTYRPPEASDRLRDLLAELHRRVELDGVTLDGLERVDVIAALQGLLGDAPLHPAVAALGSAIWRQSGGNPFFVGELFADLLASGSIQRDEHGWTATMSPGELVIPVAAGDVVRQRARTLTPATRRILDAAAVAGLAFDPRTVRTVVDLDAGEFADALDEAEAAGLVRGTGSGDCPLYEFGHALVRDVLYGGLSPYRRGLAHQAMARAVEATYPDTVDDHADELALHYSLALDADDAARAVWYAAVAAARAERRLAHSEAVVHYRRALDALPRARVQDGDLVRCRLLVDLGGALQRAGDPDANRVLLDASRFAAELGDGQLCAAAVLACGRGIFSAAGSIDRSRVEALRAALELIGPDDEPVRAMLLANLSIELRFDNDHVEQDRLSDEATAIARRLGDAGVLIPVLGLRLVTLWRPDRLGERLALAAELEALCERAGRPQFTLIAATMGCQTAMEAGDVATADRRAATIDLAAEELRQPTTLAYARLRQSMRAVIHGDLETGERLAREAYDLACASGQPDADVYWVGQCFSIRFHQGRLEEVAGDLAATAQANPRITALRAGMALLAAECGRPAEARAALDVIFGPGGSGPPDDLNWMTTIAVSVHAAAAVGHLPLCASLVERLKPYRDQFVDNTSTFFGSVERYIALGSDVLGCWEDADEAFGRAVDAHTRLGAPILLARTQLEWAEAIAGRGRADDRGAAVELFSAALTTAEQLALSTIERRARSGLEQLGVIRSPPAPATAGLRR